MLFLLVQQSTWAAAASVTRKMLAEQPALSRFPPCRPSFIKIMASAQTRLAQTPYFPSREELLAPEILKTARHQTRCPRIITTRCLTALPECRTTITMAFPTTPAVAALRQQ